ncbi:MAG: hypothetical protein AAFZ11_06570 [Pseudomonadota bacterium]
MFGADTELVFGAMQMATITAGVTGAAVYLLMRRKRKANPTSKAQPQDSSKGDLEERVRVLERIATDPAQRLAEEFEHLERADKAEKNEKEQA